MKKIIGYIAAASIVIIGIVLIIPDTEEVDYTSPGEIEEELAVSIEEIEKSQFGLYMNLLESQKVEETMKMVNEILLVNKVYSLPSDYDPGERPEATEQLNLMIKDAKTDIDKSIQAVSGYRTYDYQEGLYSGYAERDGEEEAAKYSAKPGHSEHQTGLAFDIGGEDSKHWVKTTFEDTEEGKWLMENAHKYGYILRYPKGKTNITGYIYEPWHYRYIGIEHATNIYERDITLEEYLLQ